MSASIEKLTVDLVGEGQLIDDKPIHLKIIRPSGPSLTLIDLSGITHNTYDGNESSDIHEQTTKLVKKCIESEEAIVILCVKGN